MIKNKRGLSVTKTHNYIYQIINIVNNKMYIGCHTTDNLDDGYMGSGKYLQRAIKKYGLDNFKKVILNYYDTVEEMFAAEKAIITPEFIKEDGNYNLAVGGKGGHKGDDCYKSIIRSKKISDLAKGFTLAIDQDKNRIRVSIDDPRFITKELVGHTKGKVTVKNSKGVILSVDVGDSRIESGELVGITKGLRVMKDKDGNRYQVTKDDPRIKSGELVGNTKGYTQSKESNIKRSKSQKGTVKPKPLVSCIFCQKTTTFTNIIRWHKNCNKQHKI